MRALGDDELRAAHDLVGATLHHRPVDDAQWAPRRISYAPGRTFGVFDPAETATPGAGGLVATAASYPSSTAVPGGAVLPVAAVARVGVRADRTRRGLLTALMRAQLDDLRSRGDVLALLCATETGIYGRFGYGVATRGRSVRVRASRTALRPQAPEGGPVRLLAPADLPAVPADVHDALALRRPGGITRPPGWWEVATTRHESAPLLAAVHTGPDGDDGFALAVAVGGGGSGGTAGAGFVRTLRVTDMHAADTTAAAALWRFLLGIDLVAHLEAALRPLDDPLDLLLADPRTEAVTEVADETWLRMVDVPAALAARSFPAVVQPVGSVEPVASAEPGGSVQPVRSAEPTAPVLLAVHDPLLPDNAGVYRLGGGTAERVAPLGAVAADLECDVAALSMAYLGDRAPSVLAATGWWTAHDPAALPRADALFATGVTPWCGTHF